MGEMSELSFAITELRNAAQSLLAVADTLADLSAGSGGVREEEQPKKESPKPLTLEAVRAVLAEKSRSGYTAEIKALLEKHGAAKLSEIDPAKYPAMLAEAEVLGNG